MLTINSLISRIKKRLPDPVYKAVDQSFWIDVLMEETLPLFSSYYPKVIERITVTADMAIEVIDSKGFRNRSTKYVIPMTDDLYPYIGISTFNYPRNFTGGGTFSNPGLLNGMTSRLTSAMGAPDVRHTGNFESPNIIEINPPAPVHLDFSVSMHQLRRLEEIKTGYHDIFKKLFEADCKIALYYKFYQVVDGGMFGGVELKDFVTPFLDFEDKRDEIIEFFETDYYKDSDRFEEILNYNPSYS